MAAGWENTERGIAHDVAEPRIRVRHDRLGSSSNNEVAGDDRAVMMAAKCFNPDQDRNRTAGAKTTHLTYVSNKVMKYDSIPTITLRLIINGTS